MSFIQFDAKTKGISLMLMYPSFNKADKQMSKYCTIVLRTFFESLIHLFCTYNGNLCLSVVFFFMFICFIFCPSPVIGLLPACVHMLFISYLKLPIYTPLDLWNLAQAQDTTCHVFFNFIPMFSHFLFLSQSWIILVSCLLAYVLTHDMDFSKQQQRNVYQE